MDTKKIAKALLKIAKNLVAEDKISARPPERRDVNDGFKLLEKALKRTALPTEKGTYRKDVDADEFMLMHVEDDGSYAFKHSDTRNYLIVNPNGKISIPTGKSFMRGFFDSFDDFEAGVTVESVNSISEHIIKELKGDGWKIKSSPAKERSDGIVRLIVITDGNGGNWHRLSIRGRDNRLYARVLDGNGKNIAQVEETTDELTKSTTRQIAKKFWQEIEDSLSKTIEASVVTASEEMDIEEFAKEIERAHNREFPKARFNYSTKMPLGDEGLVIRFGIQDPKLWDNKISDNDPSMHIIVVDGVKDGKLGDNLKAKLLRGGSILINPPEGSYLAYGRAKTGWRDKKAPVDRMLKHFQDYMKKLRKVADDNEDNMEEI